MPANRASLASIFHDYVVGLVVRSARDDVCKLVVARQHDAGTLAVDRNQARAHGRIGRDPTCRLQIDDERAAREQLMRASVVERGIGCDASRDATRIRSDQAVERRDEACAGGFDRVTVHTRNLHARQTVVDAQFSAEPSCHGTGDARADGCPRSSSPSDLPRTGSSATILPGNGAVIATGLAATAVAAWSKSTAPSPKNQDETRRDVATTSTGGAGGPYMLAVGNDVLGPGNIAVPAVRFVGSRPPPWNSISHLCPCASAVGATPATLAVTHAAKIHDEV